MKVVMLILLNIILIEILTNIPKSLLLGTLVSNLPEGSKRKRLFISVVVSVLIQILFLLFASFVIRVAFLKIVGLLFLWVFSVWMFIRLIKKKAPEISFVLILLIIVICCLVESSAFDMDSYSLAPIFAYTHGNIYLVIAGGLISILSFAGLSYLVLNISIRFRYVGALAYFLLFILFGLELYWYRDFILSIIPGWHTTIYTF